MTKDEIYERLAQVYLGKREQKEEKNRQGLSVRLLTNVAVTIFVLLSVFYGLCAFFSEKSGFNRQSIIFALTNNPIRIVYNLHDPYPQVTHLSISIPRADIRRYNQLSFSIRSAKEGSPGIIKVILRNKKNETSTHLIKNITRQWQRVNIAFSEFSTITDWSNLTDISFVIEAWNADSKKGAVLIDDLCFSNEGTTSGM